MFDSIKFIIIIIFICCFIFMLFQLYEFIQNYDYIIKFNEKYENYEYISSPSYNYIDKRYYDPNDDNLDIKKKIKLVKNDKLNKWMAMSNRGLIIDNKSKFLSWSNEMDGLNYIFEQEIFIFTDPCGENEHNEYCDFFLLNKI